MFNFNSPLVKVLHLLKCFTENLALHKQAWQSSTLRSYSGADRAVDGQYTDLNEWEDGGQCATSDGGQRTVEWRVDLGGVKTIHHVFLQYATDNNLWGTASFKLIHTILFNQMYCIYNSY